MRTAILVGLTLLAACGDEPDERVVLVIDDAGLTLHEVATGADTILDPDPTIYAAISSDGRFVVSIAAGELRVVDRSGARILTRSAAVFRLPRWAAGDTLVWNDTQDTTTIVPHATGTARVIPASAIALSGDGSIASYGAPDHVVIESIDGGDARSFAIPGDGPIAVTRDGRYVIVGEREDHVTDPRPQRRIRVSDGDVLAIGSGTWLDVGIDVDRAISPAGRAVLVRDRHADGTDTITRIDLETGVGELVVTAQPIDNIAFLDDDTVIYRNDFGEIDHAHGRIVEIRSTLDPDGLHKTLVLSDLADRPILTIPYDATARIAADGNGFITRTDGIHLTTTSGTIDVPNGVDYAPRRLPALSP